MQAGNGHDINETYNKTLKNKGYCLRHPQLFVSFDNSGVSKSPHTPIKSFMSFLLTGDRL